MKMKHQEKKNQNNNNNNNTQPQQLTFEQLRDVQDALRRPLSGRSVLIPLGPKAFVPGQLRPHLSGERQDSGSSESATVGFTPSSSTPTTSSSEEEYVSFKNHLDGTLQQMTRQQAMQHLQEEMNLLVRRGKPKPPQHSILKNKKNEKSTTKASSATNNTSSSSHKEQEENASCLPFMEIREEYDETGQRVWSEAIDVTKRLELLEQQVLGSAAASRDFNGGDDDDDINKSDDNTARDEVESTDFSVNEEEETSSENKNKHQVSDQEYNVLNSRLEELARLEEEEEISKTINQASAKKLQSKGWSKGFLNNKKKLVVARPKPTPKETATAAPASAAPVVETVREDKKKVVGFHEETTVKEIPRVGERSVQDIQKIKQQQRQHQQPVPSRPLENSVFSGVIRERRPTAAARRSRGTASQMSNSTSAPHTTTLPSSSAQPKKASRFVQQRRQLG